MTAALTSVNDTPSQVPSLRQLLAAEARAALARRKISNRRFAAMLGAKPAWVDRRLNGTTAMDADDIDTFAQALGMTAEELTAGAFREARRIAGRPVLTEGYLPQKRHLVAVDSQVAATRAVVTPRQVASNLKLGCATADVLRTRSGETAECAAVA